MSKKTTPKPPKATRRSGKIVLYREQVETILVHVMGCERECALRFWQLARWETSTPGCLKEMLRRETAKVLFDLQQDGGR